MFMLNNPSQSTGGIVKNTGFQSLVLNNESAQITDATSRRVEFSLSDDMELLDVHVDWSSGDNSRDLTYLQFYSWCVDGDGNTITNSHKAVTLPVVDTPVSQSHPYCISTPSQARKIIFECVYVDIKIHIKSRATFEEPQS
ncbi:hypothetical protein [Vibrio crassostreae]|uniref:hypothetical protein n=1 Tax=Vibrio crassostreae TaxID=246167 RepID=UPI001049EDAF|nr:hypothetical protein [Vibrio crassostreae]TCT60138.1 hypothetical protein EDB31_1546 [Vibrio crassostreae]